MCMTCDMHEALADLERRKKRERQKMSEFADNYRANPAEVLGSLPQVLPESMRHIYPGLIIDYASVEEKFKETS